MVLSSTAVPIPVSPLAPDPEQEPLSHVSPAQPTGRPVYLLSAAERTTYRRFAAMALPRHTSYPIAPVWQPGYGPADFRAALGRSAQADRPLSLYVHIPFCERLCYYCACTKEIVPRNRQQGNEPGEAFLQGLEAEAARMAAVVGPGVVRQIHLGGGSPTFLSPVQLQRLWESLKRHFCVATDAEVAVELDPRVTTLDHLQTLRALGFNRVSLGIQDFAPDVQQVVNRVQPFELVQQFVGWCRAFHFASVNFDLIYGLPFQTLQTMADTLEKTVALAPDRIAFYRLAVLPEMFRWQNVFRRHDLPAGDLMLEMNLLAINHFLAAGYEFIGLDHFAKPGEALAQAHRAGTLRRTFQGMTTGKGLDVLGLGPSAISQLDDAYAQNVKTSAEWGRALRHDLATERGLTLTADDRLRRELLQQLYGHGAIEKRSLEAQFAIVFDEYFADELRRLDELAAEGLVVVGRDALRLTAPLGRLLVRVVAAVFDRYLPRNAFREGLPAEMASKVG
jgi:oxygen-independent coproporphyrinogen-3 oxidase